MQLQSEVFLLLVSRNVRAGAGRGCGLDNSTYLVYAGSGCLRQSLRWQPQSGVFSLVGGGYN